MEISIVNSGYESCAMLTHITFSYSILGYVENANGRPDNQETKPA